MVADETLLTWHRFIGKDPKKQTSDPSTESNDKELLNLWQEYWQTGEGGTRQAAEPVDAEGQRQHQEESSS